MRHPRTLTARKTSTILLGSSGYNRTIANDKSFIAPHLKWRIISQTPTSGLRRGKLVPSHDFLVAGDPPFYRVRFRRARKERHAEHGVEALCQLRGRPCPA